MRSRLAFITAGFLAVVVIGVGGVYAYDQVQSDRIADGVRVAGIDVGGLSSDQARAKVQRELAARLDQPVIVRAEDRTFKLTPRQARVGIDVQGSVDAALAESRHGTIVNRMVREVQGEAMNENLPARITYSTAAVRGFVNHVNRKVARKAADASLEYSGSGIKQVKGKDGLAVDKGALQRNVESLLDGGAGSRTVDVPVHRTKPKVTAAELAKKYPTVITIDRGSFKLHLFKGLKEFKTYSIAVGASGYDTPTGLYSIQDKTVDPTWHVPNKAWAGSLAGTTVPGGSPENPLKARWMGIYNGAGIHGTAEDDSIGSAASHGCIRMHVSDVIDLYDRVDVGNPVYIA
jgi:L,D-transpeptidase catalytic domain/Putative peptidoglycan binding domain